MNRELQTIIVEVEKAVVGKREVIEKILMALLADGHVLLDDIPGVGKTTLAVALSRTLGLTYNRISSCQIPFQAAYSFPMLNDSEPRLLHSILRFFIVFQYT